jgi:hypothetical protein
MFRLPVQSPTMVQRIRNAWAHCAKTHGSPLPVSMNGTMCQAT